MIGFILRKKFIIDMVKKLVEWRIKMFTAIEDLKNTLKYAGDLLKFVNGESVNINCIGTDAEQIAEGVSDLIQQLKRVEDGLYIVASCKFCGFAKSADGVTVPEFRYRDKKYLLIDGELKSA
jgi:predicted Zn-ribbon and HTH transcriptional regulator